MPRSRRISRSRSTPPRRTGRPRIARRSPPRPPGPRPSPCSTSAASSRSSSPAASASSTSTRSCSRTTRPSPSSSAAASGPIILSGGPMSVYDEGAPKPDASIWSGRLPVLGICYGAQLMALELGGDVLPTTHREYGPATVQITRDDALFDGHRPRAARVDEPRRLDHPAARGLPRDRADRLDALRRPRRARPQPVRDPVPPRGRPHAARPGRAAQLRHRHRRHRARPGRRPTSSTRPSPEIRERVDAHAAATGSDGKVICALSGGVDSAVAAALVHRAVGDRLTCIYVDHGLMRKKESELLRATFEANLGHAPGHGRRPASGSSPGSPASRTRSRSAGSSATSSSGCSRRRRPSSGGSTS